MSQPIKKGDLVSLPGEPKFEIVKNPNDYKQISIHLPMGQELKLSPSEAITIEEPHSFDPIRYAIMAPDDIEKRMNDIAKRHILCMFEAPAWKVIEGINVRLKHYKPNEVYGTCGYKSSLNYLGIEESEKTINAWKSLGMKRWDAFCNGTDMCSQFLFMRKLSDKKRYLYHYGGYDENKKLSVIEMIKKYPKVKMCIATDNHIFYYDGNGNIIDNMRDTDYSKKCDGIISNQKVDIEGINLIGLDRIKELSKQARESFQSGYYFNWKSYVRFFEIIIYKLLKRIE